MGTAQLEPLGFLIYAGLHINNSGKVAKADLSGL